MNKKRTKGESRPTVRSGLDLARVANRLRGNPGHLRTTFSEVRGSVAPTAYDELVSAFRDNPFYRMKIFGEPFPRSPAQFKRLQPLQALGASNEFLWAESLLKRYCVALGAMQLMRDRVVRLVLEDSYDGALSLLEEMEATHGVSMWSYAMRFFLRNRIFGQDSNNVVYTSLRTMPGINGLTYFLLFYMGFRMSPGSTAQHIRRQAPTSEDVGESLSIYISYKLTPFSYDAAFQREGLLEALLRHETNSSAFDLLSTYSRVAALALDRGGISRSTVGDSVRRVSGVIGDGDWSTVLRAASYAEAGSFSPRTAAVLNSMDAIVASGMSLEDGRLERLLDALGWVGKSRGGLSDEVRSLLGVLARSNGDRQAAAADLERVCTTVSGLEEACCAFEIGRRLWLAPAVVSLFGTLNGVIASGCVLPDIAEFIVDREEALAFLDDLEAIYGSRPSIELFRLRRKGSGRDIDPNLASYANSIRLCAEGCNYEALDALESFSGADAPALRVLALRARLELATGAFDAAISTITGAYLIDHSTWAAMPVLEVTKSVIAGGLEPSNLPAWAVLLEIATTHVDQQYARRRSYAVEDAWESRGLSSPSKLVDILSDREKVLGIYYLRVLCTSETMSDSDRFQSVRELEEERIRVCQALVELDPAGADAYLSEIKSITRWLVIYDGLRSIEQSKVYVDIEGLKAHLITTAGHEYDRMLALRRERIAIGNVDDLLRKDVAVYRDDEIVGNPLLRYTSEDPINILRYLLVLIFNEYASNSRFGLDVYLSTRIRHGTLKGHLRSPLEDNKLICQRSGEEYLDQPYWTDRIRELSSYSESALLTALQDFSALIDEDIADLNGRYLRLRSPASPDGWFDITPVEADLAASDRYLEKEQPNFSKFLDIVFDGLNAILGRQLYRVQSQFFYDLRQRWSKHLRDLREAGLNIASPQLRSEFDAATAAAQVAIDIALERVASWFALSTAQESPDYTIELAIDIAARSIENCFGSNVLIIEPLEGEGPYLRGRTLASLVDVFFILFENIIKHARNNESAKADVSVARKDRFYTITVRNALDESVDAEQLSGRVVAIKESLRVENEARLVSEGGTGYHKLRKILGHDLRLEHDFDFGVVDNFYEVTILLDAKAVLL